MLIYYYFMQVINYSFSFIVIANSFKLNLFFLLAGASHNLLNLLKSIYFIVIKMVFIYG